MWVRWIFLLLAAACLVLLALSFGLAQFVLESGEKSTERCIFSAEHSEDVVVDIQRRRFPPRLLCVYETSQGQRITETHKLWEGLLCILGPAIVVFLAGFVTLTSRRKRVWSVGSDLSV